MKPSPRPPLKPGDRIRPCFHGGGVGGYKVPTAYARAPARVVHVEADRVDYEIFPFRAIYATRSWIRVP